MTSDPFVTSEPASIPLLAWIGEAFNNFASIPLDFLPFRSVLPLTGFTILHSLRVAYLYHSVLSSQGVKVGRRTGDVSFLQAGLVCTTLVMSGTTMAALLQGKPSGLLAQGSGEMVTAYMLGGVLMKWLHPFIEQVPQLPLQILCFFIDGFATTFGTLSLGLIPTLNDPAMISTLGEPLTLPTIIIPLLCGSGASLLVPFFGLFQPRFSFGHPGFLSERLSVDFWGPWLISLCYGTIVDGRGLLFGTARQLLSHGILSGSRYPNNEKSNNKAWMRPDEAHVLCSLILSTVYVVNEFGPRMLNEVKKVSPEHSKSKKEIQKSEEKSDTVLATGLQTSWGQLSQRTEKKTE